MVGVKVTDASASGPAHPDLFAVFVRDGFEVRAFNRDAGVADVTAGTGVEDASFDCAGGALTEEGVDQEQEDERETRSDRVK